MAQHRDTADTSIPPQDAYIAELRERIRSLDAEVSNLRGRSLGQARGPTVKVPPQFQELFDAAEATVGRYFEAASIHPERATIEIHGERYVLVRSSALSYDFLGAIRRLYSDRGADEAHAIARALLFDFSHAVGMTDAANFHKLMQVDDPIARLSAGPVHFAYSGWAFVEILPESRPSPDEDYVLTYNHPYSFEADSWLRRAQRSKDPVCIMNCGYSSGWCEQSFGVELTAVEVACRAAGDEKCTFIMAPPHRIEEHLLAHHSAESWKRRVSENIGIPTFFERKRVDEERERARAAAEEATRAKSEFLANMSHDLRSPLNSIIGYSDLLRLGHGGALPDRALAFTETIRLAARHLLEMVNDVLDLSRIEAGQMRFEPVATDVGQEIDRVCRMLSHAADAKDIRLVMDEANEALEAVLDPKRLREVISNFLSNAIRHTPRGGVITVRLRRLPNERFMLEVKDSGAGVAPADRDRVFEPFVQVEGCESAARANGGEMEAGTGIGLALVKRIVELQGGSVGVRSQPGEGAAFFAVLPLDAARRQAEA